MSVRVTDNPDEARYEIRSDDDELLGFAAYQSTGRLVVFTHTEVEAHKEGQGVGSQLVRGALDDIRARGLHVIALCPFVQEWIRRHPDYVDLDYRRPPSRVTD